MFESFRRRSLRQSWMPARLIDFTYLMSVPVRTMAVSRKSDAAPLDAALSGQAQSPSDTPQAIRRWFSDSRRPAAPMTGGLS